MDASRGCCSAAAFSRTHIACIRSAMNDACARKILDLSEVTLVDIGVSSVPDQLRRGGR